MSERDLHKVMKDMLAALPATPPEDRKSRLLLKSFRERLEHIISDSVYLAPEQSWPVAGEKVMELFAENFDPPPPEWIRPALAVFMGDGWGRFCAAHGLDWADTRETKIN